MQIKIQTAVLYFVDFAEFLAGIVPGLDVGKELVAFFFERTFFQITEQPILVKKIDDDTSYISPNGGLVFGAILGVGR